MTMPSALPPPGGIYETSRTFDTCEAARAFVAGFDLAAIMADDYPHSADPMPHVQIDQDEPHTVLIDVPEDRLDSYLEWAK